MTNQDKKEFLKRYLVADRRLTVLIDELEIWRSRVTKITPFLSGLPGGSAEDPLQMAVERIAALERRISKEIVWLMLTRAEIREAIEMVQDKKLRLLLEYRYIHGKTWEEIAERMNYSWRQIMRLHKFALSAINMS